MNMCTNLYLSRGSFRSCPEPRFLSPKKLLELRTIDHLEYRIQVPHTHTHTSHDLTRGYSDRIQICL